MTSTQKHDSTKEDQPAEKALALVSRYVPKKVTPEEWARVADFVRDLARTLVVEHDIYEPSIDKYIRVLMKLATFADRTGISLQTRTLVDPLTINQFAHSLRAAGDNSAGTYQSQLRYVGELLNPKAPWEKRVPVSRRTVAPPYSPDEVRALTTQVRKNKPRLARAGETFLALGLGAGLDGRWAYDVEPEHVIDDVDGIAIAVDGRIVPVIAEWEDVIRRLVRTTPAGARLHGLTARGKNAYSETTRQFKLDPGTPTVNGGRLRSTWMLHHLNVGTRLRELVGAAGTVGAQTFADLLPHVPPIDPDPAKARARSRAMLRGDVHR